MNRQYLGNSGNRYLLIYCHINIIYANLDHILKHNLAQICVTKYSELHYHYRSEKIPRGIILSNAKSDQWNIFIQIVIIKISI